MNIIGIIPARYASTRFPGKPLVDIKGKSMIQRVYEQTMKANNLNRVIVATDDERIFQHVEGFGGEVFMTKSTHQSGTERCAELVEILGGDWDIVVNVQGDEPFIQPSQIDSLVDMLYENEVLSIATLAKKIEHQGDLFNPNVVKVVMNKKWEGLYFSRQTIPYLRDVAREDWLEKHNFYRHLGLYAYRADLLPTLAGLSAMPLEEAESLEQLRWLSHGYRIGVQETTVEAIGIDTPEDLERVLNEFK